jgi:beta-glucuronidase
MSGLFDLETARIAVLVGYFGILVALSFYGCHRYIIVYLYRKYATGDDPEPIGHFDEEDLPPEDPEDPTGESRRIVTEMVERDLAHPSVIAWDLGNSAVAPGEGIAEALDQLRGTVTGLDDSRLVVAACRLEHVEESAAVLDRSDIVCVNADRRARQDWDEAIDAVREVASEKPLVVTEFGVEGVPGERSLARREESESHQADYLADAVETFRDRDDVAGFAVRQFTDTLAGARPDADVRTTDYSGLFTAYRRPKEAYRTLRRHLAED